MTLSIWLDTPGEKKREHCDVAIIGGGIMGSSAAYWLSRRQGLKTVLVEAGKLGSGASGRNAGFILRGIRSYYNETIKAFGRDTARFLFELGQESQRHIREFVESCGNSFHFDPSGSYLLACSLEELQDLSESAELMQQDGFAVEYIKKDPLDRDFYGALFNPGDQGLHPVKLLRALVAQSGAALLEDEAVTHIEYEAAKGITLHTPRTVLTCDRLLMATNAHTPLLEPSLHDKVKPARGQILVTQPLRKVVLDRLCYANYGWEYFRQLQDHRLLIGGCRELHIEEETGYADIVTHSVQASLEAYLKDRFPDVAGVGIDYRWSGIMGFSADGLPLLGAVPGVPGAHFLAACNGHGMGYSLALSRLLVEFALDDKDPGIFDARRAPLSAAVPA